MKKILLGTSALAAVALTAGAASAEAPTVTMDGQVKYAIVMYDNDVNGTSANRGWDVGANSGGNEIRWTIAGVADNGLEYTGRIDYRYISGGIDESWIKLGGGWGTVVLGNDDDASSNVVDANSVAAGDGGVDGTVSYAGANIVGSAQNATGSAANADSAKITYFTPDFGGFAAGVSVTPTDANGDGLGYGTDSATANENGIGLLGTYNGDFGGVGVSLGAGYLMADATNAAAVEDVKEWHIGGVVSVADFSIGAGYSDRGESGLAKDSNGNAGTSYNLGVGYTMGDLYVAAVYTSSEYAATSASVDDEFEGFSIGANYTVAEGLSTYADITVFDSNDGSDTSTDGENTATTFLIGTAISF